MRDWFVEYVGGCGCSFMGCQSCDGRGRAKRSETPEKTSDM